MAGKQPQAIPHSSQEWLTPAVSHPHFFKLKKWSTLKKEIHATLDNMRNELEAMQEACHEMNQLATSQDAPSVNHHQ